MVKNKLNFSHIDPNKTDFCQETEEILSDIEFSEEIRFGLSQIDEGKAKLFTLEELFSEE